MTGQYCTSILQEHAAPTGSRASRTLAQWFQCRLGLRQALDSDGSHTAHASMQHNVVCCRRLLRSQSTCAVLLFSNAAS